MATLAETLGAQANPTVNVADSLSSGVQAGIQLATAAEQVQQKKTQTEAMKAELITKQANTANSLLTNLARANPMIAKKMLPQIREKLLNLGVSPDVADYTISDDAARQRQIAFSQYAGGKLTSNPQFAKNYFDSMADIVGYDQTAQMFDNEMKRKQQDKQFAVQMSHMDKAEAKQDQRLAREDEKITRQETQKLSAALAKDSIPDMVQSIKDIDQQVGGLSSDEAEKKLDKIAGLKGFAAQARIPFTNVTPFEGLALNDADKPLYQSISGLRNVVLKLRSGGAITDSEATRMLEELGQGSARSGAQLLTGIKNVTNKVKATIKTVESGFDPESVSLLAKRGNPTSSESLPQTEVSKSANLDLESKIQKARDAGYSQAEIDAYVKGLKPQNASK